MISKEELETMRKQYLPLLYPNYQYPNSTVEKDVALLISTIEALQQRNDDMLNVLEKVKADVDRFSELTGISRELSVEEQAAAYNSKVEALQKDLDQANRDYDLLLERFDNRR